MLNLQFNAETGTYSGFVNNQLETFTAQEAEELFGQEAPTEDEMNAMAKAYGA